VANSVANFNASVNDLNGKMNKLVLQRKNNSVIRSKR